MKPWQPAGKPARCQFQPRFEKRGQISQIRSFYFIKDSKALLVYQAGFLFYAESRRLAAEFRKGSIDPSLQFFVFE